MPPATEVANAASTPPADEAMPLPKWLMRIYYIFPVVLYIPDAIFNFYVYSDGAHVNITNPGLADIAAIALFAFLSAGIVGMAWLLSVFAPWHWGRGHKFQSIMCWFGVVVATAVTIWNSLSYRSQSFTAFNTDHWLGFNNGFSVTMILVAVAPPFWGLFWAIVQPSESKRSRAAEEQDFQTKLDRMKQEAELKRVRAEANATIRAAQIQGLAATARAARAQIGGALAKPGEEQVVEGSVSVTPEQTDTPSSDRIVALPAGTIRRLNERRLPFGPELSDSGEHEIVNGSVASMSYSVAAQTRGGVFEAPAEGEARPAQSMLPLEGRATGEHETLLSTSRTGMPRASTLLRNYAENEHVMRAIDADVEQMRTRGLKITIKTFAEYRGIDLSLAKQLLAKWREWKAAQVQPARLEVGE